MQLADTSAWIVSRRADAGSLTDEFDDQLVLMGIAICDMVRFELLRTTRNGKEMAGWSFRLDALPAAAIGKREWKRALWVYQRLADLGGAHHRSVGHADLLIAAAAETAGIPVLHYDEDFERIAAITGQPTEWIVPRGSV